MKKIPFIILILIAAVLFSCSDSAGDINDDAQAEINENGTAGVRDDLPESSDAYIDDDITEDDIIDVSKLSYTEQYLKYGEILIDWSEIAYCEVVEIEVKWFTYEEYKELMDIFENASIWVSDNRIRAINLTPEEEAQRMAEGDPILEGLKNGTWQFGTTGSSIIGGDFICDCCGV